MAECGRCRCLTLAEAHLIAPTLHNVTTPVFTLWSSITAAVGEASRPTRSRSAITSRWFMVSNKPVSRYRANQANTVLLGGKSIGNSRHATPSRST